MYAQVNSPFEAQLLDGPVGVTVVATVYNPPSSTPVGSAVAGAEGPSGTYTANLTIATTGTFLVRWTAGSVILADEAITVGATVVEPPPNNSMLGNLVTLEEAKAAMGTNITDTRKDAVLSALIPAVSTVIRNYTERDFGAVSINETRMFDYDGSGYLDIDDAAAINTVVLKIPQGTDLTLDPDAWYPAPPRRDDAPVFYYLVINGYVGASPEMGFVRNTDVLYAEGRWPQYTKTVAVTATWGWPTIPEDVKLAAVWTIQDWMSKPANEGLTGESIESYSRNWAKTPGGAPAVAIPNRARDILAAYQKTQT